MLADERFRNLDKPFWAHVRTIGQHRGYTERGTQRVKVHSLADIIQSMSALGLQNSHLLQPDGGGPSAFGQKLLDYFVYRANVLTVYVEPRLMDVDRARDVFDGLKRRLNPTAPLPMNRQTGEKAGPAYFSGIINMLIEENCRGEECDYSPKILTSFTRDGIPLRTLGRRLDGCFPSAINPGSVWEIKEYYYTTTFGSRVADGVYETLLDGLELEELREHEGVDVQHLLMVDAHYTWWVKGRSYLCRLVDILHMGYVDEILFGYEVVERLPGIVARWASARQT